MLTFMTKRVVSMETKTREWKKLASYWKETVARYVKTKREAADKSQAEVLGVSRRTTVSEIEQGKNVEIDTLIEVLTMIGGDVSECFRERAPKEFQSHPHRHLFDLLAELIEAEDDDALTLAEISLRNAREFAVRRQRA